MITVPSKSYQGFDQLQEAKKKITEEISKVDWEGLRAYLRAQPKDKTERAPVHWMIHQSTVEAGECTYEDNVNEFVVLKDGVPEDVGSWFHLSFKDGDDTSLTEDPVIAETFKNLIEHTFNLPGLFHVSMNYITPKFCTPEHTDGFPGYNSILSTFSISENNPELVTLEIDTAIINFKDREFFTFDPETLHQAINSSDTNWVFMIMRIKKEFFNYYEDIDE
jgi:hypothetical protein